MKSAFTVLALVAAGCAHRPPTVACAEANRPFAARAMADVLALASPPPATLEAGFVLCSRDHDRLLAASAALGEQGYSSYIGASKRGECLRVVRGHEASAAALEREIAAMCTVAEAQGIAYRHWQTEVGGKTVRLAGGRLTVDGKARRLAP